MLRLHPVFTDHMVVQQRRPIRVAGVAKPGEAITGFFDEERAETLADGTGRWTLVFAPREAARGGSPPAHTLIVKTASSDETRCLSDILMGEVWLASGQSNMEFRVWDDKNPAYGLRDGADVAGHANDPSIRILLVPRTLGPEGPRDALPVPTGWRPATSPETVAPCSAVAYLFARKLREKAGFDLPVGIISAAWGGTRIESWIPESAYRNAGRARDVACIEARSSVVEVAAAARTALSGMEAAHREGLVPWFEAFNAAAPAVTAEARLKWAQPSCDLTHWHRAASLAECSALPMEGVAWFRTEVTLPEDWEGRSLVLRMGAITDVDEAFWDGVTIGKTTIAQKNYWALRRDYTVPAGSPGMETADAQKRTHVLALRIASHCAYANLPSSVTLCAEGAETPLHLESRVWFERLEFFAPVFRIGLRGALEEWFLTDPSTHLPPAILYNGMIHGATHLEIGGVLWYQGCANAGSYRDYAELQRLLIASWREAWGHPNLPFLVTQLSSFQCKRSKPPTDDKFWERLPPGDNLGYAPLRSVQESLLDGTAGNAVGVACTIDAGDPFDLHPRDKATVADRLVYEALRIAYGHAECLPGPRATSAVQHGAIVEVRFRDAGDGLVVDAASFGPRILALRTEDGTWHWASGKLSEDRMILFVWLEDAVGCAPLRYSSVQYAYTAYPEAPCLYRAADGIPVFPFQRMIRDDGHPVLGGEVEVK